MLLGLSEGARVRLARELERLNRERGGNGRLARSVVELSVMRKAGRVMAGGRGEAEITDADLSVLEESDLVFPS